MEFAVPYGKLPIGFSAILSVPLTDRIGKLDAGYGRSAVD
jgi:hypothetical protein